MKVKTEKPEIREEFIKKKITMRSQKTKVSRIKSASVEYKVKVKSVFRKAFRHKSMMKFCLLALLVGLLIIVLFYSQDTEAKKIKIKLKDLKKLKKYGYLLAGQTKKTYAIPFPVPLPVFIKRQQIYTQVPVVPRYIHQAPTYHSMVNEIHSEPYSSSASSYLPETKTASMDAYGGYSSGGGGDGYSVGPRYVLGTAASYPIPLLPGGGGGGGDGRGKYMSPLSYSTLLGGIGASRGSLSPPRDLVNKFLTGQARVLSPKSLLTSLKSQPIVKQIAAELASEGGGSSAAKQSDTTGSVGSSGGNSTSSATSSSSSVSSKESTKTAASEQYLNLLRPPSSLFEMQGLQPRQPHHNHLHHHHLYHNQPGARSNHPYHYLHQQQSRQVVARVPRVPRHPAHRYPADHHAQHNHPQHQYQHNVAAAGYSQAAAIYNPAAAAAYLDVAPSRPIAQTALLHPAHLIPYTNPITSELLMRQLIKQRQQQVALEAAVAAEQQQLAELTGAGSGSGMAEPLVGTSVAPTGTIKTTANMKATDDIQEPEVTGSQDYEVAVEKEAAKLTNQQQMDRQLMDAVQRRRRQVALRLALLAREREQAQVAESQAILIRAHQMGLPIALSRQARLVNY